MEERSFSLGLSGLDDLLGSCSSEELPYQDDRLLAVILSLWQQEPRRQVIDLLLQLHGSCCGRTQQLLLDLLAHDPILTTLRPRDCFVARLMKQLTMAAEDEGHELLDELLDKYLPLIHSSPAITPWGYKTFYLACSPSYQQLQQLVAPHTARLVAALPTLTPAAAATATAANGGGAEAKGVQQQQQQQQQQQAGASGSRAAADAMAPAPSQAPQQQQPAAATTGQPTAVAAAAAGAGSSAPACDSQCLQSAPCKATAAATITTTTSSSSSGAGDLQQPRMISVFVSDNLFEGSTGCHEWEAGFVLAEWLAAHQELLAGRRVMELGCGAGLVGVLLAASGASKVMLTDGNTQVLGNCVNNLVLNGVADPVLVEDEAAAAASSSRVVLWQWLWEDARAAPGLADIILAADVLYDPQFIPYLLLLIKQLLQPLPSPHSGRSSSSSGHREAGDDAAAVGSSSQGREPLTDGSNADSERGAGGAVANGTSSSSSSRSGSSGHKAAAYVAATKRQPKTMQLFMRLAPAMGMTLEPLEVHVPVGASDTAAHQQQQQQSPWPTFQGVRVLEDRSKFVLFKLTLE